MRTRSVLLLALSLLLTAAVGCDDPKEDVSAPDAESTEPAAETASVEDGADLVGPVWRLVRFQDGRAARDTLEEVLVTVQFRPDGQVAGQGGCNRYSGGYEVSGDTLTFGAIASTKRACMGPAMDVENRYFEMLRQIRSHALEAGRLNLYDEEGSRRLTFHAADTDPGEGTEAEPGSMGAAVSGPDEAFEALGQEPGWRAVVTRDTIRYEGNYGETIVVLPTPMAQTAPSGVVAYDTTANDHALRLVIREDDCTDVMSGQPFSHSVTITVDGEMYRGCGEPVPFASLTRDE